MTIIRQLKIDLIKYQNEYSLKIQKILSALLKEDTKASLLPVEKKIASRILDKKLCDMRPDEHVSFQFDNAIEQTSIGSEYLPTGDFTQNVTLYIG